MVDLKSDNDTFKIHPEDEAKYGDLTQFKEYNESMESYIGLMNTFLNRRDRRKLSRYKGFKAFSDRFK